MMRHPEVVIVGAGPAGIAAALRLARAGVRVLVFEGADYAGAENWSGCVYHAEPLLREDVLGRRLWAQAPVERRVVARRLWFHDGAAGLGFEARSTGSNDYGEAWTALRPKIDRWLAARAIEAGAVLLPGTTVTGLLYDGDRVCGVRTERGTVRAGLVFLADGDAAGLAQREGLEQTPAPHYAQGAKAVFALPASLIESRFQLAPGEGLAQEWVLRNVAIEGHPAHLDLTAFLYTNQDSLSLGFVAPLAALAAHGPSDHSVLLGRLLEHPAIRPLLAQSELVAYGAKVIRAGGISESPAWTRPGLLLGGSALGLGLEMPYPNFIGPALATGVHCADAFLAARQNGRPVETEYGDRLRASVEYANAQQVAHWPQALHQGHLLFDRLPAFSGHWAASAAAGTARRPWRRRALAALLAPPFDWGALRPFLKALQGPETMAAPPLEVTMWGAVEGRTFPLMVPPALARAVGYVYGRREALLAARLRSARAALLPATPTLALGATRALLAAGLGTAGLLRDALSYRWYRGPLAAWLAQHPYHEYEQARRRPRAAGPDHQALAWLGSIDRGRPDRRHIHLPAQLTRMQEQALARVCPAEVYVGPRGLAVQYENCIKCESCRIAVPAVDWTRTSSHRLRYRLPEDRRFGWDGSAFADIAAEAVPEPPAPAALAHLAQSLAARPAFVTRAWANDWLQTASELAAEPAPRPLPARLAAWLRGGHFGWAQRELGGAGAVGAAIPRPGPAPRDLDVRAQFEPRLATLARDGWALEDKAALAAFLERGRPRAETLTEWLAEWSPALAWIAVLHWLAPAGSAAGGIAALTGATRDGQASWVPGIADVLVDAGGRTWRAEGVPVTAHAHALDAARPVRRVVAGAGALAVTPELARLLLALHRGMAHTLSDRAFEYASTRVQFAAARTDRQGREAIAKFGSIKAMLARIEATTQLLARARADCRQNPEAVLNLVSVLMAPALDGLPWVAGQIFGGMAYSEEDLLAPRYRDAMLLAHWPGIVPPDEGRAWTYARTLAPQAPLAPPYHLGAYLRALPPLLPEARALAPATRTALRPRARVWRPQPMPYRSGDFIHGRRLGTEAVLTPEHFLRDPTLRATRAQVLRLLRSGFRAPAGHASYGRYIDEQHGLPADDIRRLRAFNAFATTVPVALGGRGWHKSQYAVLTRLLMGRVDTSAALLVMASTSIGTTPVLLGLEKDLPRWERALAGVRARDWQHLRGQLTKALAALRPPRPRALRRRLKQLIATARAVFMAPGSPLRYPARPFLEDLFAAAGCGERHDLEGLERGLVAAAAALDRVEQVIVGQRAALPHRRWAHERFLSALATGEISAFGLTEPGAGSDTGALQSHAVARATTLSETEPGFYRFEAEGRARILIDAARLETRDRRRGYLLPGGGWAPLVPGPRGAPRWVEVAGVLTEFHDIGRVRRENGRLVYRYWELSGAKMWITNGSIADRLCVYARTEDGETGFMLDARSEGLSVGRDERKLGQRASPTNELRFDRVRIELDDVIGFEGHGQANALETLSVGRGGIVAGCAVLLERLLSDYPGIWARDPVAHAAARCEWQRVETLAARIIGLTDTVRSDGDFRIEAGLSKYLASEGLHRVLLALERILGPQAAAIELPIEKWRRDARILNIYEGTNEVQRFLVLKDLPQLLGSPDLPPGRTADALASALARFQDAVGTAVQPLGPEVWMDPDLQARWFVAVDWLGELYVWSALAERLAVITAWDDPADQALKTQLQSAIEWTSARAAAFAGQWSAAQAAAQAGTADLADEIAALANEALDARAARTASGPGMSGHVVGRWVVIVRAHCLWAADGPYFLEWQAQDLAALDCVLAWADDHGFPTGVVVLAPPGLEDRVRRFEAAGADVLYLHDSGAVQAGEVVSAVAARWPGVVRWVAGPGPRLFAQACASILGAALHPSVTRVEGAARGLWITDAEGRRRPCAAARPAVLVPAAEETGRSDRFSVSRWLEVLRAPPAPPVQPECPVRAHKPLVPPVRQDLPAVIPDPSGLAQWLQRRYQGRRSDPQARWVPAAGGLPAAPVLLTSAGALPRLGQLAAFRAALDLGEPFSIIAIGPAGALPDSCSSLAAIPGCLGVWLWSGDAPALAPLLRASPWLVFGEDVLAAGLTVAHRLGRPLHLDVQALGRDLVWRRRDDALIGCDRASTGALAISDDYVARAEPVAGSGAVPLGTLPAPTRAREVKPPVAAGPQVVLDVGLGIANGQRFSDWVGPLATALADSTGMRVLVGGTRKVVQDLKLLPPERQIGQTGIRVAPDLLLAIGVSGAPQHLQGIDPRTVIVAINRDPQAPVFHLPRTRFPNVVTCCGPLEQWLPGLIDGLLAAPAAPVEPGPVVRYNEPATEGTRC